MNESTATLPSDHLRMKDQSDHRAEGCPAQRPAVIVVAPPWPRSGTARVIQNQIDYYRHRGFCTFLVSVPFHWAYMNTSPIWNEITEGIMDLDADQSFIASLEQGRYNAAKYITSLRHAFRGTALDWIIGIGRSTRLTADAMQLFRNSPVALLHVNHVYTLGFALQLRKKLKGGSSRIPIILDTHDVQSHLLLERGDKNPWTKRQDSMERLLQSEIAMLQKVDALMHLSVEDNKFFQKYLPEKPHILSMPTIDETFVAKVNAMPVPAERIDLLFVGQSHAPNLAAMRWFFADVWPLIEHRNYKLRVVGAVEMFVRESLPEVHKQFRSCFVGPVADLAPYYRGARCVIAPMVSGSGISIKTIEALALGKPFVGTSKAYRGIPMEKVEEAGLRAHDDASGFAGELARTLANEAEAGATSRNAYDRLFSKEASFAARDAAFSLVMKKPFVEI